MNISQITLINQNYSAFSSIEMKYFPPALLQHRCLFVVESRGRGRRWQLSCIVLTAVAEHRGGTLRCAPVTLSHTGRAHYD